MGRAEQFSSRGTDCPLLFTYVTIVRAFGLGRVIVRFYLVFAGEAGTRHRRCANATNVLSRSTNVPVTSCVPSLRIRESVR